MAILFRPDPEDDSEGIDQTDPGEASRLMPAVPRFAVIVSEVSTDGWHLAAVIGESANPNFYVRAVAVRWPFLVARPVRSNRSIDKPMDRDSLSPAATTPARKLVVNWGWVTADGSVSQLRFYVKRFGRTLFRGPGHVKVRLTLKESAWPQRRIVVAMKSNRIIWTPPSARMPASPPPKST
ncbi:MAG TPA: hypothetical protein VND19_07820 [Acetobacteraceae bacterium]|nr:hypothetical protein [Acetobacteraceae bacterium]